MPISPETISRLGLDKTIAASVNDRENGVNNLSEWDAAYYPCAEAYPAEDVARGAVTRFEEWSETEIYAGTTRDLWVYLPAVQSDAYRIIVFNDGAWYMGRNGPVRATKVLDVLHANGEIPPTVAVLSIPGGLTMR